MISSEIVWRPRAEDDFRSVHWETGARIAAAIERFGATGEGLRRIVWEGAVRKCVLVPPYAAIIWLDRRARVVNVLQIVRYAA